LISLRRIMAALLLWIGFGTAPLWAHPLGNFTINHLTKLAFDRDRVVVHYVLDMAEIPTYQAMRDVTPDGKMDALQLNAWAASESRTLVPLLEVSADGRNVPLTIDAARAHTNPGAGGLPTMYLTIEAHGSMPAASATATRRIAYADTTFPGRLGWHDVVVAPATEPTHELTHYPSALIGSPRQTTSVGIQLAADGRTTVSVTPEISADTSTSAGPAASQLRSNQLSDM
jgi:nickel/cobalt exporter